MSKSIDNRTPEVENQEHRYVGNHIPWYVHVLWVSFWILAVAYTLTYAIPAIRQELLTPP